MQGLLTFFKKSRIVISRIFTLFIIFVLIFTGSSWQDRPVLDFLLEATGFVLILVCTFGRIWTLSCINGHKTRDLITWGPYSIVRNPLYLFSFIGAVGLGLASRNILVLAGLLLMFVLYYPFVVIAEERRLMKVHPQNFADYARRTPRIIPAFALYHIPKTYPVDSRLFLRAFISVMWFPLGFIFLLLVKVLHAQGVLPILFTLP
jgi:protein-S-isoprenylcysteine O-methyltransferase Ste14